MVHSILRTLVCQFPLFHPEWHRLLRLLTWDRCNSNLGPEMTCVNRLGQIQFSSDHGIFSPGGDVQSAGGVHFRLFGACLTASVPS